MGCHDNGVGLSCGNGVYVVGEFSGAHLNPALTITMAINAMYNIMGQILGTILGAVLVYFAYLPHWGQRMIQILSLCSRQDRQLDIHCQI